MAVIWVAGLPAESLPSAQGGSQHHHLPGILLPSSPVDLPLLCKSQEPGGPGIAGKGYANTSKKFLRTWEEGGGDGGRGGAEGPAQSNL